MSKIFAASIFGALVSKYLKEKLGDVPATAPNRESSVGW